MKILVLLKHAGKTVAVSSASRKVVASSFALSQRASAPFALLLLASVLYAQNGQPNVSNAHFETRAYSGNLDSQLRSASAAWFGYAVKAIPGEHDDCCWNGSGRSGCWLEEQSKGSVIGSGSNGPVQLEGASTLVILFRAENNAIQKMRVYSLSCALDAGGLPFVWVTGVPEQASLSYLEALATNDASDRTTDGSIMAISQHAGPEADTVLQRLTRTSQPERVREKSTFWLGASRGARGVQILKSIVASDPNEHVRDKAVFALSISHEPEALDSLIQTAKADASAHVRGQAIFWLAQKAGKRASSAITDAIENDPDTEVKKRAVFALSQLPKEEGVPKLIEVARNQKNREVRKQAFFWLGQSQDLRALAYIQDVLTK